MADKEGRTEVPADAVINELIAAGMVSQQAVQLAANTAALRIENQELQSEAKDDETYKENAE